MRKALVVGINYYDNVKHLHGCVNDSENIRYLLERNEDGSKNFDIRHIAVTDARSKVTRKELKDFVTELFIDDSEVALFYFSGHGYIESTGGYLITSECSDGDDGFPLAELLSIVNQSRAKSKIVIIDACHSGITGSFDPSGNTAFINEGISILTASSKDQYAIEQNGTGVFTSLLVDALKGGAANLLGEVSPGSIYLYVDQSLGSWQQRPIFKTNVKQFTVIRKAKPPIELSDLQKITILFPTKDYIFQLDPSYEPERNGTEKGLQAPVKANTDKFKLLQKYNRLNLLVPVDAPHMWHAAMNSKQCCLTALGKHYWNLVSMGRL